MERQCLAPMAHFSSGSKEGRHESPSEARLLDSHLADAEQRDGFLEQTTLADHALVFQDGFTFSGPRTYSILDGPGARDVSHVQVDWPTGAMDRKFGEHEVAFMNCGQELSPGQFTKSNVIHEGAKFRCSLNVAENSRGCHGALARRNDQQERRRIRPLRRLCMKSGRCGPPLSRFPLRLKTN